MSDTPQRRTYISRIVLPQPTGHAVVTRRPAPETDADDERSEEPAPRRPRSFRDSIVEKGKGS